MTAEVTTPEAMAVEIMIAGVIAATKEVTETVMEMAEEIANRLPMLAQLGILVLTLSGPALIEASWPLQHSGLQLASLLLCFERLL